MIISKSQKITGMKLYMMNILSDDIRRKRYDELQKLYESLHLRTNQRLVQKMYDERNVAMLFTDMVYMDIMYIIADSIETNSEVAELFENLYKKRYPKVHQYVKLAEEQYKETGHLKKNITFETSQNAAYFFRFLIYKSDIIEEPTLLVKGLDCADDARMLKYVYQDSDKNTLADTLIFCSNREEWEHSWNEHDKKTEFVFNSPFFKKYLLARRKELADYLNVEESELNSYIHETMRAHTCDTSSKMKDGVPGLIELSVKNMIADNNGGAAWYNEMTTTDMSKQRDTSLHYVPDVKYIIENYFKSFVMTRFMEEMHKNNPFTKLTLSRECKPQNYELVYQAILCMYEMDVLYKMFFIMLEQYYRDFSWERITNQTLSQRYEDIVSNLEEIIRRKDSQITDVMNQNHTLSLGNISDVAKQTSEMMRENTRLSKQLAEKDDTIEDLKRQLALQEQYIEELSKPEEEIVVTDFDLAELQGRRYLFVGHISDALPSLKHKFPNSIFMESETCSINGLSVDAVVMVIKRMSHSMFYKVKANNGLQNVPCIMCNSLKENVILQDMYDGIEK